jgi:16S rRNA C967 or C1407 C5-methylase (RsmB/RsmF family)
LRDPEQNRDVVEEVLKGNSKFVLLDCGAELEALHSNGELATGDIGSLLDGKYLRTIPGVHPYDGFFAALIERQS